MLHLTTCLIRTIALHSEYFIKLEDDKDDDDDELFPMTFPSWMICGSIVFAILFFCTCGCYCCMRRCCRHRRSNNDTRRRHTTKVFLQVPIQMKTSMKSIRRRLQIEMDHGGISHYFKTSIKSSWNHHPKVMLLLLLQRRRQHPIIMQHDSVRRTMV